ncbi:hypothetical protein PG987_015932 [Apiospora arundinis]
MAKARSTSFRTLPLLQSRRPLNFLLPLCLCLRRAQSQKVHSAADRTATWQFGEAFLKVKDLNEQEARCTREHVTLARLHARGGWTTFDLPRVLYHGLWDNNRYVLLTTAVRGRTFGSWWPSMNEEMKNRCVNRVIEACKERLSGRAGGRSYTNDDLVAASKEMGMNCYVPFHFYHCDLGPGNILVDVKEGDDDGRSISNGIIDWEIAGFVPWEWIMTKFRVSAGLDLPWQGDSRLEYRRRVRLKMGELGFPDVVDAFTARKSSSIAVPLTASGTRGGQSGR